MKAVHKVISFARLLRHYKGPIAGQPFEPDPFQAFILGSLFGWVERATGLRRFRYGYVEIPRKNGKSFLAAVVALFLLSVDGEAGAEVYSTATRKDQAKIVWNDACKLAKRSPALRGKFRERYSALEFEPLDGRFEPLPADSDKLDGLNPHGAVNDELHAWTDRFLWDQIEDALGARAQPMIFSITTAGYNRDGICYEQRTHAVNVLTLEGYDDERTFGYIACPDPEECEPESEAWKDPKTWRKANPALGTAKREDYMRALVAKAVQMPSKEFAVKTKQLNIWTVGEVKWLDVKRFEECGRRRFGSYAEPFESMAGRECYTGLDLSSKVDFSAAVHLFPPTGPDEHWAVLARLWIPEETMREREKRDRIPVEKWVKEGWITPTDGEIIDHEQIVEELKGDGDRFAIQEVGFDPYMATQTALALDLHGLEVVQMPPTMRTLAMPTKELEAMVIERKLEHFGNPVLCWMARNTQVVQDANGNVRPDKKRSPDRIDGIVALIMALGRQMVSAEEESVYETRGPIVL